MGVLRIVIIVGNGRTCLELAASYTDVKHLRNEYEDERVKASFNCQQAWAG